MPRSKPRHIDVIRIEMGTKERQLLDDALLGYQVKSIGTPLVALISDVSAMSLLISAYAVYRYGDDALDYFKNEAYDDLSELYKDFMNVAKGLPVIRQGIDLASTIEEIFDFTPAQPNAYWNQPDYDPSMQGGRTR